MSKRELNNSNKIKYTLWLTNEEKSLLELRAEQYGYRYLSDYLRDAGVYNDVILVDISYTESVNSLFTDMITEIRKLTKEVRRVMKYDTSASPEEREMIQQALYRVYSQTKSLKKSVNDNINVSEVIKKSKVKLYKKEIEKEFNDIVNSPVERKTKPNIDAIISRIKLASEIQKDETKSNVYNEGWQDCLAFVTELIKNSVSEGVYYA